MLLQISTFSFLLLLLILFYLVPRSCRKWVLLVSSIVFIRWQGRISGLLVITFITAMTWLIGIIVHFSEKKGKEKLGKIMSGLGIIMLALILFGWKYIYALASALSVELPERFVSIGIPVGLSFFIFQAISYLADISMKRTDVQINPFRFALYMMWFPKWMSGPIERKGEFDRQIDNCERTRFLDKDKWTRAMSYVVWGLFMKLVIADRLGVVVDTVFADIPAYGAGVTMLASLLYTIQIYCDFAGYTNTMIGVSSIFGIELTQNFRLPYLAENIVEFWRLWHISLSSFLKDYVYIPLGGNRKGQLRKAINTLIVFFVCGMWHGAGLNFIVWGLLHGILNVASASIKKSKAVFLVKGWSGRIITFCLVSFAWIFFRASSLKESLVFIKNMIPGVNSLGFMEGFTNTEAGILGISSMEWWIAVLAILLLIVIDIYARRREVIPPEAFTFSFGLAGRTVFVTLITIVILIFGRYGAGEEIRSFVYMQF